jgi:hypothetical protein
VPVRAVPAAVAPAFTSLLFSFLVLVPGVARAADLSCAAAYEQTQLLRQRGNLSLARDAARACARPSCPDVARKDCTAWQEQIGSEIPTVIVIARDEATGDEGGIRVQVDGVLRPEASGGHAFELDPGAHVFHVERSGDQPLDQTITVVRGERDRPLRFVLHPADPGSLPPAALPPGALPPAVLPGATPPRAEPGPGSLVPAGVAATISVLAFGASAWLGVTGRSDLSHLRASCAPSCTDAEVDPVRSKLLASDILLGAGVLGSAVTIYLFAHALSRGPVSQARIDVRAAAQGGVLLLRGEF